MNARAIQLDLDLFGRIDQYIRAVDKEARAGAAIWDASLACLDTDAARTSHPGRGNRSTASQELDLHMDLPPTANAVAANYLLRDSCYGL